MLTFPTKELITKALKCLTPANDTDHWHTARQVSSVLLEPLANQDPSEIDILAFERYVEIVLENLARNEDIRRATILDYVGYRSRKK